MRRLFVYFLAAAVTLSSSPAHAASRASAPDPSRTLSPPGALAAGLPFERSIGEAAFGCSSAAVQGGSGTCGSWVGGIAWKGVVDSTGMRYISIGTSALSSAERAQVQQAMYEWNMKAPTTKISFVDNDGWWGTDIEIEPAASLPDGACGEYDPANDTIRLHENLLAAVNNHPHQLKSTVGHELSHFLGLNHI